MLLGESKTLLSFVVVDNPPVDLILSSLALQNVRACIRLEDHTLTMSIKEKDSVLDLYYDQRIPDTAVSGTDSEYFTSNLEIYIGSSSPELMTIKSLL